MKSRVIFLSPTSFSIGCFLCKAIGVVIETSTNRELLCSDFLLRFDVSNKIR